MQVELVVVVLIELKSESVSGDWVVAINVGMIDCHARRGAAAWR